MRYEKIIKRKDGSKIKVIVEFWCDFGGFSWSESHFYCAPNKRTYVTSSGVEQEPTQSDVNAVKLEFWETLKPTV